MLHGTCSGYFSESVPFSVLPTLEQFLSHHSSCVPAHYISNLDKCNISWKDIHPLWILCVYYILCTQIFQFTNTHSRRITRYPETIIRLTHSGLVNKLTSIQTFDVPSGGQVIDSLSPRLTVKGLLWSNNNHWLWTWYVTFSGTIQKSLVEI